MRISQLLPADLMDRKLFGITMRVWFPIFTVLLLMAGLLSPLFDLSQIHGVAGVKLYTQHFYFDFISGLGGYYAATFCTHAYHRVPLFVGIDLISTLALVTLIG